MKVLRILRSWSQVEAAKNCCTTSKCYWLWESGKVYPRKSSQKAIALAFEVPLKDIFEFKEGK
ncbi:transcriptional regulator [Clostridium botulinum D/C]|nr:transcriptional regulator [Clostridium botulinum]MCD3351753.1 transcriptional regulator [Clostridium botulinum D/C]MCD3360679.1 transcriptional regulator [Clostridium botulinum D/C]MCD3362105.1 transcriptional regulator [Clostridium botulinum D/C]MCD3366457.1 transcriptional regulator [Clostridium botulinum D/C]